MDPGAWRDGDAIFRRMTHPARRAGLLALLLLAVALPAVAAAAVAHDLFVGAKAIGSGWKPSGKVRDVPSKFGVQGTPQLSPDTVASVAARDYRRAKGIHRKRLAITITIFKDAGSAGVRIDDLIRKKGNQGISRPLDLGATIGERSVGDQGQFGELRTEFRFKSACFLSGARVVCMTLDNRKGHGKPSTTRLRHAARAEAAKLAATP
jgi:hypothetical protein